MKTHQHYPPILAARRRPTRRAWALRAAVAALAVALTGCGGGGSGAGRDPNVTVDYRAPVVEDVTNSETPIAFAGPDQRVLVGTTAALHGQAIYVAAGSELSYAWKLSSRPDGSAATIQNASSADASLTPDVPGAYVTTLVVSNRDLPSTPDSSTITATPPR